jgi:hypothetical protein
MCLVPILYAVSDLSRLRDLEVTVRHNIAPQPYHLFDKACTFVA